jgi:hypothetical protein
MKTDEFKDPVHGLSVSPLSDGTLITLFDGMPSGSRFRFPRGPRVDGNRNREPSAYSLV